MSEDTPLAVIQQPQQNIVELPVTIDRIVEHMEQFQSLKAKLLGKSDVQAIGDKLYVKRSGWRKLALAFNISDEILRAEKDPLEGGGFVWRVWTRVTAPNGRVAVGVGSCASNERRFAHEEHDTYAIAHTRSKNRAISDILGSGEVSAEEMQSEPPETPDNPAARAKPAEIVKSASKSNEFKASSIPDSPQNGTRKITWVVAREDGVKEKPPLDSKNAAQLIGYLQKEAEKNGTPITLVSPDEKRITGFIAYNLDAPKMGKLENLLLWTLSKALQVSKEKIQIEAAV